MGRALHPREMVFRLVAAVLGVLGAGVVSAAPRIVNGTFTAQFPSAGALLQGGDPASASIICSGTLIGCRTFLTAGHCVCDTVGGECQPGGPAAPDPSTFFVFLQHAGVFAVSGIEVHPDFAFPQGDVAVLHLAAPVTGVRPTPINTSATPTAGMPGTIVGFGNSGSAADYGLKRVGHVATAPCTPDISSVTSTCFDFVEPVGPPGTNADTCNGDSGGPLFVDFGCGPAVAGVTSGGSSAVCTPPDHSYDANVFTYAADIAARAGTDLDAPTCGSMPQAGDPGAEILEFAGDLDVATPQATHVFTVPSGTTRLRVALNAIDDGAADFDLYVRASSPATVTTSDCAREGVGQFATCEFSAPTQGSWYVLVNRFRGAGPYQITATTFAPGGPAAGVDGQPCDDGNVCTGTGTCTAGRCSGFPLLSGNPCDDGSGCTSPDLCQAGVCVGTAALATGCRLPAIAGKSVLQLKDTPTDTHDQVGWKWNRGAATSLTDFGDPAVSTAYELCVFEAQGGVPTLLFAGRVPPGPLWTPHPRGFKYRDRSLAFGGLSGIDLRAGDTGAAGIGVKAAARGFHGPLLPLAPAAQVTVQFHNNVACWAATYSASTVNDARQFKAKSN